jgi:hypothetical protein
MTGVSVTHGTFSTLRVIKTRSVAVLEIEVPLERMNDALTALGGIPLPGKEPWVAVALLKVESKRQPDKARSVDARERYASSGDMQKATARAALLCQNAMFQKWIAGQVRFPSSEDETGAAQNLRTFLNIRTRSEIGTDAGVFQSFLALESRYKTAQQIAGYGEAPWSQ